MVVTSEEIEEQLTEADRAQLIESLKSWRDNGVENPHIPLGYDADGDGGLDAWALDENDELVLIAVEGLDDTVFESEGDGVEVGGNGGGD